jgi:DUF1365 family protein
MGVNAPGFSSAQRAAGATAAAPEATVARSSEARATAAPGHSSPLRSALYECAVMHHRLSPLEHRFTHHIFMLALDLDELDEVARRVRGFSHNRRHAYEFRDRDHLTFPGLASDTLKDHLLAWIAGQGHSLPAAPTAVRVTLVTLPRVFGYVFNPVSFYFVHEASTGRALCAVAEVRNTFGEMKPYLLPEPQPDESFQLLTPKYFYVSPFSSLDLKFHFKLRPPNDGLEMHVDEYDGEVPVLLSALTGRRRPLTTASLWGATLKCPLVTMKVIFLIHWQALRLWLKRVPWHPKADDPDLQRDVLHPHVSLSVKKP